MRVSYHYTNLISYIYEAGTLTTLPCHIAVEMLSYVYLIRPELSLSTLSAYTLRL